MRAGSMKKRSITPSNALGEDKTPWPFTAIERVLIINGEKGVHHPEKRKLDFVLGKRNGKHRTTKSVEGKLRSINSEWGESSKVGGPTMPVEQKTKKTYSPQSKRHV